jgi:DNA polymerase-1
MSKENLQSKMILQVHDELVFDVHKDEIEQMQQLVKKAMEDAVAMEVPMEVEMKTAPNWLEAH